MDTSRARLATMAALSVAVLTATLTACTSEPMPPDRSTTTRTTTSSTTPPPYTPTDPARQPPQVPDPLDDTEFVADPCSSLTPTQLTELQLVQMRENDGDSEYESEVGCGYVDSDPAIDLLIYVNYYPDVTTGLRHLYANHVPEPTPSPSWTPTTINGHPAVSTIVKHKTTCQVYVGTSDTTLFEIAYYYYNGYDWDGRDTCAAATTIAAAVLTTMNNAN